MKSFRIVAATFAALAATLAHAQTGGAEGKKQPPLSPPADTAVTIAGKAISIKYSSPSMRGRKIFGELVPYGKPWRAGANAATALHTTADLDLGGLSVPKGDYTLYVLPEATAWKLIVSKQTGQGGDTYDAAQDLGRADMKLSKTAAPVEVFKITLSSAGGNKGQLQMEWENTGATISITAK